MTTFVTSIFIDKRFKQKRYFSRLAGHPKVSTNFNMEKPLNEDDFAAMEDQLKLSVENDRRYWKVNDVKCDAIYTAKNYEEFADRVAAAHLNPLHKDDYKKKCARKWNQYASEDKKSDE